MKFNKEPFLLKGKKTEDFFASMFEPVFLPTKKEDIYEHWDVSIGIKVDVKGMKKIRRHDSEPNENIHYIEIKTNTGHNGWAYGEADFFAFETESYFVIVEKKRLQEWIAKNVQKEYNDDGSLKFCVQPTLYHLYQKKECKDILTLVKTLDLCAISTTILQKPKTDVNN